MTGSAPESKHAQPPQPAASRTSPPEGARAPLFMGAGEMRARCRTLDWAATPLGPVDGWPPALCGAADIALASAFPTLLLWGPRLVMLYNDAYLAIAGSQHPSALGRPARDAWPDNWGANAPLLERAWAGETVAVSDAARSIRRGGPGAPPEATHFTISYAPVRGSGGAVEGILITALETTAEVERRRARAELAAANEELRATAARLAERTREAEVARHAAEAERARLTSILHGMSDAHVILDSAFRYVSINPAAERALGRPAEELFGRSVWELFPGTRDTDAGRAYVRVAADRIEAHLTQRYRRPDGDVYLEIDAYPTGDRGVAIFWRDVTERVRGETALRESEARLRAIYDGTHEYIGLIAPDGTVLDCNRASLEFANNAREDVLGRPLWETPWFAHTPDAPAQLRAAVARAAAGEFIRYEATLLRPGGEPTTFDFSLHPIRDADGIVRFIVPEGRDITQRRRAEAAQRDSDARYRSLFESMDDGFCVLEMIYDEHGRPVDYRFLEANASFMEQTGLVGAVGRTARELVPTLEEHWFETYGRVATTGQSIRFQNGSEPMGRWFDVFAFRTGRPEERRVALLFKDVSAAHEASKERERLIAELGIERARLREVFQHAPSFIVAFRGPEHRYEFANEAYYQLVGARDLIGRPLLEALPELSDQGFHDLLDGVLATGEPWVGRETPALLQRTPGAQETRYLNMVFQPLVEADGSRSGVVAHGYDVTEQVRARREVERLLKDSERARAEAEAANRSKSEFLAVMSHELRTPLNAISGYTDLLEMGVHGPVNDAQRQSLSRIQLSQRHLLGLINEVLDYARLETGKVQYDISDTPVRDALSAAESLVAPQARARDLELSVGECPPSLSVRADPEKLRQILVNLLSNAVKFSRRGGRIDMVCARADGAISISVADTGIGIPADKLEVIFDPFVQVRGGLTRTHEGTGLGLAISRDLARSMGGDLTAQSTLEVGSTFTLTLPAS